MTGLLVATGRRTVSSWLRAGQLSKDYQDYYYFLTIVGRKVEMLAGSLLRIALEVVGVGERVVRLHVGLEGIEALWGDIDRAIAQAVRG